MEKMAYSLFVAGLLFFVLSLFGIKEPLVFLALCGACGGGIGYTEKGKEK